MSIDKSRDGLPEINVHRPGTKVNLGIITGIVFFLVLAAAAAIWTARRSAAAPSPEGTQPVPTEKK